MEQAARTTYQRERWPALRDEMMPLVREHWREVAIDHDRVPLDIDDERYTELDECEALRIITVRREGVLIGYHFAIFGPHLHYRSTPHYITDVYYIAPSCRHGITAMRLFEAVERDARSLVQPGQVVKFYTAVKLHLDQGPLFERLGYRPTERLYTRVIGA